MAKKKAPAERMMPGKMPMEKPMMGGKMAPPFAKKAGKGKAGKKGC